jgi:hypothetical protein
LSNFDEDDKVTHSSADDTSLEDTSGDDSEGVVTSGLPKKKRVVEDDNKVPSSSSKRSRRLGLWHPAKPSDAPEENVVVDTSILSDPSSSPRSVFDTQKSRVKPDLDADDDSSANKKNLRLEMIEQSMIVSEVAMKLEEFARKAMKIRGTSRTRRGVAGVVTPPWGASPNFPISTRGLITYDDEYENEGKNVIADGDDSLMSEDSVSGNDSKQRKLEKELLVPPVPDIEAVKKISSEIRHRASFSFYHAEMIHACANVSEFFMSTPPNDNIEVVCNKVLQLFTSSSRLAADFHFYRAALHPENAGDSGPSFRSRFEQHHAVALRRALEGEASKRDALREFKIFAVNLIYKLLGKNGSFDIQKPFSQLEYSKLLHTAEAWSKSVGTIA